MVYTVIMSKIHSKNSALYQILLALVPYTRQNMLFVFKPSQFLDDLEKTSNYSHNVLCNAYQRAKTKKMFQIDNKIISFSLEGRQIVQPFIASYLINGGQLMVIFDIPEVHANLRRNFRTLLRYLQFKQIQQSVWMTDMDHRAILIDSINEIGLQDWVQIYESARII